MFVDHSREKLINAIVYFAANTEHCGKTKLYKLLFLLDFGHFAETGTSVTSLDYAAWEKGPVPPALNDEWGEFGEDMLAAVDIKPEKVHDHTMQRVVPIRAFDKSHFTRRELRHMEQLAAQYRNQLANEMIDHTHEPNSPWSTVWRDGKGKFAPIDYELAIPQGSPHREQLLELAADYSAMMKSSVH